MNQMPNQAVNTVEDSVLRGHDAANRAFQVLDSIDADLSGAMSNAAGAGSAPVSGLVYAADELATRINILAERLENVRARIASPKEGATRQDFSMGKAQSVSQFLAAQNQYRPDYTG